MSKTSNGYSPSYFPSREQFHQLAQGATLIPVYREVIADLDTPVSALAKLGESPYRYLLESVEGGDRLGRYSIVGNTASLVFRSRDRTVEIGRPAASSQSRFDFERRDVDNPFDELKNVMQQFKPAAVPGLPRFYGGAVGYLGYDMVRFFEDLPPPPDKTGIDMPDSYFIVSDVALIFDHAQRTMKIVANAHIAPGDDLDAKYDNAVASIEDVVRKLRGKCDALALDGVTEAEPPMEADVASTFDRQSFEEAVRRSQALIHSGELLQVVLSQRFSAPFEAPPFELYRVLRTVNPSPYMYYLHFDDVAVVGSSPEVMVRLEDGIAQVRPIAGTRPRGATEAEDLALEQELLHDAKERAEHLMLVDLGRNDLGRVCEFGGVQVDEFMAVERYSHVMHIVSNVVGKLAPGNDAFDLLRATFPAGTVSGAPKVRAMQVIDELEPSKRGAYAGAIGYFGFSGNMDTCITIRTVIVKDGAAHFQTGAGIVADSVPADEYQETLNKAKAMFKALAMAKGVLA